ncbi:hypothetical protein FB99_15560 [Pantoea agglomerans]|nr:hypothetical protein FB99_15560 [Pantoea agglomerans]
MSHPQWNKRIFRQRPIAGLYRLLNAATALSCTASAAASDDTG